MERRTTRLRRAGGEQLFAGVFGEFEDVYAPETIDGDGDVKYHLGFSSDYETAKGHTIHLSLSPNPSPSTNPDARATTFFRAPHSSTPIRSGLV